MTYGTGREWRHTESKAFLELQKGSVFAALPQWEDLEPADLARSIAMA